MRILAYLIALVYASQAIAGLPPTKLVPQVGAPFTNYNFKLPNQQATKVTGGGLIETGNRNLLADPDFEANPTLEWGLSGSASYSLDDTTPLSGKQSLLAIASAQTIAIEQNVSNNSALDGTLAQIKFVAKNTAASVTACVVQDGTPLTGASNCVNILTDDKRHEYVIPTVFGTSSTGVRISAPSTTGQLRVDSVELGDRLDVSDVQQARWFGTLRANGSTNCGWALTDQTTWANFAADNDCNAFTATGSVAAPATRIPAVVIPAGSPSGEYLVIPKIRVSGGTQAGALNPCFFRLSDGTDFGRATSVFSSSGSDTAATESNPDYSWTYRYSTSSSDTTIQIQSRAAGTGRSCSAGYANSDFSYGFDVYYYPPANKIFSADSLGWFIDANIGGANPDLGVANVATYTEITNAGLDLVVNTARGSQPAKILCSGTNAPGTTTCPAGNESVGLAFTIPKAGPWEVCINAVAGRIIPSSGAEVFSAFQLVETPVNAQTILQGGGSIQQHQVALTAGDQATNQAANVSSCSIFNFSSAGEKAVRLMYEQTIDGSPQNNFILADRNASIGQRDIHFTVKPAINLEKINGSFAQIEDALKEVFVYAYGSATSITSATVDIIFATEASDDLGAFNLGTSVFTAPIDGTYLFNAVITGSDVTLTTAERFVCVTEVAGITRQCQRANGTGASNIYTSGCSTIVQMTAGQTGKVRCSSSQTTSAVNTQGDTYLTISRIPTP